MIAHRTVVEIDFENLPPFVDITMEGDYITRVCAEHIFISLRQEVFGRICFVPLREVHENNLKPVVADQFWHHSYRVTRLSPSDGNYCQLCDVMADSSGRAVAQE